MNSPLSFVAVSQSRFAQQSRKLIRLAGCTALCASGQLAFSETAGAQTPAPPASTFKVTPHSPTAAALGKYVDMPVTLATGTPEITIPLYTIECGELRLPLSLSYQATGFRVSERAGWTGLGWSLTAGGAVSRSIRSLPDNGTFEQVWGKYQTRTLDPMTQDGYSFLSHLVDGNAQPDTQPDMFSFHFPGHSGRFIRPTLGSVQLLPIQPLQVSASGTWVDKVSDMAAWHMVDEQGQQLTFGTLPGAPNNALEYAGRPHGRDISSWLLACMVSASGRDTVYWDYAAANRYLMPVSESHTVTVDISQNSWASNLQGATPFEMETRCLSAIRFANGRVDFFTSRDRRDIPASPYAVNSPGEARLDSLWVRDRGGRLLKRVLFRYAPAPDEQHRLKLLSVTECGAGVGESAGHYARHTFEYNPVLLPKPTSFAQDHWGFCNGAANAGLVPTTAPYYPAGADREANATAAQAEMLTRVTYPTGGYAAYEYEGHDTGRQLYTNQTVSLAAVSAYNHDRTGGSSSPLRDYANGVSGTRRPSEVGVFVLSAPTMVEFSADIAVSSPTGNASYWTPITLLAYYTEDINANSIPPEPTDSFLASLSEEYSANVSTTTPTRLSLGPGIYYLKCMAQFEGTVSAQVSAEVATGTKRWPQVGGLRVRAITLHDGLSHANDIVKHYQYRINEEVSSGVVTAPPNYASSYVAGYMTGGGQGGTAIRQVVLSAASQTNLGDGAHIYYEQVEETVQGPANGRSRYYFSGTGKGAGGLSAPYLPYNDVSRTAPLLDKQVDFNAAGDTVRLLRKRYRTLQGLSQLTYGFAFAASPPPPGFTGVLANETVIREFPLGVSSTVSSFEFPFETRESLYGSVRGQRPQVRLTRTYYDNPRHLQPTRTVQTTGAADSVVTETRYPADYLTASTGFADAAVQAVQALQNQHRLAVVVEQLRWRWHGGVQHLVGGTLQQYAEQPVYSVRTPSGAVNRALTLPSRTFALRLPVPVRPAAFAATTIRAGAWTQSPAYEEVLRYERYDRQGSPLQVRRPASATGCLVWSDDGSQLLAEATNAPAGRVAYTSFEPLSRGGWKYPQGSALAARRRAGGRTGRWAYDLAAGYATGVDSLPAGRYRLTFWATGRPTVRLNGVSLPALTPGAAVATAPGGWVQYYVEVSVPALTNLLLTADPGQSMLLDEVRLAPAGAQVTSYTYDPLVGLTSQTDPSGRTLTYEYDALGRLVRTRDEQGRLLSQQEYHYARP